VRRQVCKRLRRRLVELGLADLAAYRAHLDRHPEEWGVLESLTHITISRFCRDRGVFAFLQRDVLPELATRALARGSDTVEVWSAGCASGEEAYTLAIIWQLELARRFPSLALRILATDVDDAMLARARNGSYTESSLRELPERWRAAAFTRHDQHYRVQDAFKHQVTVARHHLRNPPPPGPFDLVLCRNLAFTYFDRALQRTTATRLAAALRAGGALVLGAHEALPPGLSQFEPWGESTRTYRRTRFCSRQ